jgi:dsDNA-specific endonuclease/ATPase MutS2
VKEIKKALEACCKKNRGITILRGGEIKVIPYADILTYINELESENAYQKEHIELWFRKNEEKKNRIAELEKENKDYYDRLNNLQTYIDNHEEIWKINANDVLQQFAERLKKEVVDKVKFYDACIDITYNGLTKKNIDETLKEFVGEENDKRRTNNRFGG